MLRLRSCVVRALLLKAYQALVDHDQVIIIFTVLNENRAFPVSTWVIIGYLVMSRLTCVRLVGFLDLKLACVLS